MIKKNIKISVVIPTFNSEKTIVECLDSIFSQNFKFYEIIVIDDCSTDRSISLIKQKYGKKVKIFKNKKNEGACKTRNIGFSVAKGNYILFVDSDVILKNNCVKNIITQLDDNDILYPKTIFDDGRTMYPKTASDEKVLKIATTFLIKKESTKKMDSLFDENYEIYDDDTDFFLRAHLFGLKFKYVPQAIVIHKKKKNDYCERRFYLEIKNKIYSLLKYKSTPYLSRQLFSFPSIKAIIVVFLMGLFNANLFEEEPTKRAKELFLRLLKPDKRISHSWFKVQFLTLKGIGWNIRNIFKILKERKRLYRLLQRNEN